MTRGRGDSGAEVTGAEVYGAEVVGAEVTRGRVTRGRGGSGTEVSVNRLPDPIFSERKQYCLTFLAIV